MKAKLLFLTVLSFLVILLSGCPGDDIPSTDDTNNTGDTNTGDTNTGDNNGGDNNGGVTPSKKLVFVGSYIGSGALPEYTAKLTVDVKSGEVEVSKLTDIINQKTFYFSFWHNAFVRNGHIAYHAHDSNFAGEESNQSSKNFMLPVLLDVSTGNVTRCPVPNLYKDLEPWCRGQDIYIDDKGRIFYAIYYSRKYTDQHESTIFRYDPKTKEYTHTKGSNAFIATQPERGSDTEAGSFKENFAISSDGRYAYALIYGYGTRGGAYHSDYQFLVQYDFDTDKITRLDGGETSASIYGINSDYSKLTYSMGSERRYIDLKTKQFKKIEGITFTSYPHCSFSKTYVLSPKTNGLFQVDFTKSSEFKFVNQRVYAPQFDKNGDFYFVIQGKSENYICKKTDFSADTPCDTIATIPSNITYILLVE